jgi:hypothetical protein
MYGAIVVLLLATARLLDAATVWTGPLISYSQPAPDPTQPANQDRITTNVWLTRASSKGLFNAFSESNATASSPAGTEWAFGALSNYASLTFATWQGLLNGQSPTTLVGREMVLHLTADDIYISIEFSVWGSGGSGGFAYERSTPAPLTLLGGGISGGQFAFSYAADLGVEYVIDSSSNLVDWNVVATNTGSGGTAVFGAPVDTTGAKFYRVSQLPNP